MSPKKYQVVLFTDFTDEVLTVKALGAYKIASALREQGYSCLVVDKLSQWTLEEITSLVNLAVGQETLFVGFSTTFLKNLDRIDNLFFGYAPNLSIFPQGKDFENSVIKEIHKLSPDCKILLGGHKINQDCANKNVNIVVRGLAEQAIMDVANSLSNKTEIPNSYRNIHGVTVVHRDQEKTYDFANSAMHWQASDILNYRVLPFEPARGCIFNCRFCSFPQRGKKTLDYVLTEEIIYNELQSNYDRFGITTYQLLDDTFNDSDHKLDRMLSVVKQLSFQPVFWSYNRLDLLATKPERIKKLFDIGLRATSFGIETLKKETGLVVGKGFDAARQIQTVKDIKKTYGNNLLMHGLFIIGLPHETLEEVQHTFDLIDSGEFPLHSAYFEALMIAKPNQYFLQSDFDKKWPEYGYRDLGSEGQGILNWANDHMNFDQAREKKTELVTRLQQSSRYHIPGQTAWALMNYNNFTLDRVQNLKNIEIDWQEVKDSKQAFVTEYKQKMLAFLATN